MTEPRVAHVAVRRTARYYTVGDAAAAREVWVALHGYGQLGAYFARHFGPLADGRLVVVPEALNRFYLASRDDREIGAPPHGPRVGATWMTREDRDADIDDYLHALDDVLRDATAGTVPLQLPLVVLGFSQGATTAVRWLAHRHAAGAPPASRLVMWQGEWPVDRALGDAAWLATTRLTIVSSPDDPLATAARVDAMRAELDRHQVRHEHVTFAGGHRMDGVTLGRIAGESA